MQPTSTAQDERGMAMIAVILVTMVMVSLSLAVFQLSLHSISSSEYDKRRLMAIQLAERGINNYLAVTFDGAHSGASMCALDKDVLPGEQTVAGPISQTYTLDVRFYRGSTVYECEDIDGSTPKDLDQVEIVSSATVGTTSRTAGAVTRTLNQLADLIPTYGTAMKQAIYGSLDVMISNNTTIRHFEEPNDANVYAGCNMGSATRSDAFSSGFEIEGSLIARCAIIKVGGYVLGNIWAKGDISTGSLCVGHRTDCGAGTPESDFGWVTSSGGNVDLGSTWVEHSCTAKVGALLNTTGSPKCGAYMWPGNQNWLVNAPIAGIYNSGTCPAKVAAVEMFGISMCDDPPLIPWPNYTYSAAKWTAEGYTEVVPANCAAAQAAILAAQTSDTVYNLMGYNCALSYAATSKTLDYNLAIVSRGSISWSNQTSWVGAGAEKKFYFIHPDTPAETGATFCDVDPSAATSYRADAQDDIGIGNQTNFVNVSTFFYTPCTINAANNSDVNGQFIGGVVKYSGMGNLNFERVEVPGVEAVGYTASPLWIREVRN